MPELCYVCYVTYLSEVLYIYYFLKKERLSLIHSRLTLVQFIPEAKKRRPLCKKSMVSFLDLAVNF